MTGALAANVMHFAHVLRRAGVPVGPAETLLAQRALALTGLHDRAAARAALRATMTHAHDAAEVFEHAFALVWRAHAHDPPSLPTEAGVPRPGEARAAAAAGATRAGTPGGAPPESANAVRASEAERLRALDFEAMDTEQLAAARAEMRRLVLPVARIRTRRRMPSTRGTTIDLRRTIRASLRQGGELTVIARSRATARTPPLVVLCDISGSMAGYAPVLLHFLHALAARHGRLHVFLFGTRLTNVTRALRHADPDAALLALRAIVRDWSGGTRIGDAIDAFNHLWARRVLGQGASVLLITDGLDRPTPDGAPDRLAPAMERLHRSSRRLIWLNPLLRWSGFSPRATGIRAMLPHVDRFLPVHNLDSLRALVQILSQAEQPNGRR